MSIGTAFAPELRVRESVTGRIYQLDKEIGKGGEATIYAVKEDAGLVAKLYKPSPNDPAQSFAHRREEKVEKLRVMLANVPVDPTANLNHRSYAWPQALITGPSDSLVLGFVMPRIGGNMKVLFDFYNPSRRRETCPLFDYRYLLRTARNIAGIMNALHSKGYVIGDVNQKNILVSDSAMVSIIDTDSFQVRDPKTSRIYPCPVDTPGFGAPERAGKSEKQPRTTEQDLFKLGLLLFHLLMEGVHPFNCRYDGPGEPPPIDQAVSSGHYPYRQGSVFKPMSTAPSFAMLDPTLQALFNRCFHEGHGNPALRPMAKEWQDALRIASKSLIQCKVNGQHYFGSHLVTRCPWCERVARGYRDSFPSPATTAPQKSASHNLTGSAPAFSAVTTNPNKSQTATVLKILFGALFIIVAVCLALLR